MSSLLAAASVAAQPAKPAPAPQPAPSDPAPSDPAADPAADPAPAPDGESAPEQPTGPIAPALRMRALEQKTQSLKERAWQLKARVQMLKEQVLGGGVGAQTLITHANTMGGSFRLIKLIYSLDGTQVFARTDDAASSLYKTKSFDIFAGPIAPGNHNLSVVAVYRGHGYGVFEYLTKYTFTARGGQSFTAGEGKIAKVDCRGFEKGGATTPLEKRAAVECKVTQVAPEKPAEDKPLTPASGGK